MARRALHSSLRSAAQELSHLPELVDASARYAAADYAGALAPLERAAQIVQAFPAPAYQLVVRGGLAQVHRATGEVSREAALWQDLAREAAEPQLKLHAMSGAASCALHRAAPEEALRACEQGFATLDSMAADERAHWIPVFHAHRALSTLMREGGGGDAAEAAKVAMAEAEAAGERASAEAAALLLGDALAAAGDVPGALDAWGALGGSDDDGQLAGGAVAGGSAAATVRRHAALCRAGALRLASDEAASGEANLKAAVAMESELGGGADGHSTGSGVAAASREAAVAQSLSLLGAAFALKEEPLAAEGLHRTATDRLRASLRAGDGGVVVVVGGGGGGGGGGARRAAEAGGLAASLDAFAELVGAMEWNGQPRASEAAQLRQEAAALRAEYPQLLGARLGDTHAAFAALAATAPFAQWRGVEPWYAASMQPDWLRAASGGGG